MRVYASNGRKKGGELGPRRSFFGSVATYFWLVVVSFWLAGITISHATSVLIAIDNTGANDPVNFTHPRVWNFQISSSGTTLTVNRALFGLNDGGNQTTENIVFSLYAGLGGHQDANNTLLRTVTLTPADVDGFFTTMEEFSFGNLSLTAGNYSATLMSQEPAGNGSYMLKLGKLTLYNDNGGTPDLSTGNVLSSSLWVQDPNATGTAAVPEPSIASLLVLGLSVALRQRRKDLNALKR